MWFDMFNHSHSFGQTIELIQWPDGKSYLKQDNMQVMVFDIIKSELVKMREQKNG